jgi:hypothetical protein
MRNEGSTTPSRESCIGVKIKKADRRSRPRLQVLGRPHKARDAVSPPLVEAEGPSARPTRPADPIPLAALLLVPENMR